MAERKVLNKYYPPDFDPSKIRGLDRKAPRKISNVRMMLPMSVRCYTCRNYMYIGTKFNMTVEAVDDEDYLGIKIHRFYFKCTQCYSEITFKTDPKNHDYVAERGISRNHEQWKDLVIAEEEFKEVKKSEMKEDAMKSLEHRTYDSKREMDILDALDQVKTLNRRQANVNYDDLIEKAVKYEGVEEQKIQEELSRNEAKEKFKKMKEKRIEDYNIDSMNNDVILKSVRIQENHSENKLPNLGKKTIREEVNCDDSEEEKISSNKIPSRTNFPYNTKLKIKPKKSEIKKQSFQMNLLNNYGSEDEDNIKII
jgi:hypothetical protein